MKIFIDTANIEEIKAVKDLGIVSGVTTNPSLIAKEGREMEDVIKEIVSLINGPISAEVNEGSVDEMEKQAEELASIHPNIVIKVPMTLDGIALVSRLSKKCIKTNVTLVFSVSQALMACEAGATYISPFMGRVDDFGESGSALIEDIVTLIENYGYNTEIIAASIRNVAHVKDAALARADIATIPYKVLMQMVKHPLTDRGLEIFAAASKK